MGTSFSSRREYTSKLYLYMIVCLISNLFTVLFASLLSSMFCSLFILFPYKFTPPDPHPLIRFILITIQHKVISSQHDTAKHYMIRQHKIRHIYTTQRSRTQPHKAEHNHTQQNTTQHSRTQHNAAHQDRVWTQHCSREQQAVTREGKTTTQYKNTRQDKHNLPESVSPQHNMTRDSNEDHKNTGLYEKEQYRWNINPNPTQYDNKRDNRSPTWASMTVGLGRRWHRRDRRHEENICNGWLID